MKLQDNKIYLASKSPRRRELLRQIGVSFEILLLRDSNARPVDVPETARPGEQPNRYVERVTNEKAVAAWNMMVMRKLPIRPVLAADTTVVLDGVIYGKPATRHDAVQMLTRLSGQTHQVFTTVAVHFQDQHIERTQVSDVTFCIITPQQISRYCDTQEPYDKAGGYGVQGSAAQFISNISGSYSGIMGLPLFETAQLLSDVGISLS